MGGDRAEVIAEELGRRYDGGPVRLTGSADALYDRRLQFDNAIDVTLATPRERYEAFARSVRDVLTQRWVRTEQTYEKENPKRVYYISMEFLIGRSLANNVMNLQIHPIVDPLLAERDLDWAALLEQEPDAGLGNGGLGRLAACFLDSMATMALPAMGCGLRYEYGIFKQKIDNGWQKEQPDNWLRLPDPWEVARPREAVEIRLGCSFEVRGGSLGVVTRKPSSLIGIPYDRPVVGYGGRTINTLRLWSAAAPDAFDFEAFSAGAFVSALAESLAAESITRVLYPDDSTSMGQALRFVQEYFMVACSLADILRRFAKTNFDWRRLPEKVAVQMNDTHPSLAVAELMRILLDEHAMSWEDAWTTTQQTLAYTNHTLLPEALEKWPVAWFELLLPRHLEIIYEINRRFLDEVRTQFPDDRQRIGRVSLIEEGVERKIRMAHLAIVGSHSTNGVAAIHSKLLASTTVRDLAEGFPDRFSNKTNGVTPRRWLLLANPALSNVIGSALGLRWVTDYAEFEKLLPLADDAVFRAKVREAKRVAKTSFADWLKWTSGTTIDPDTIFDSHVKRIHEYKRQLLNALRIVILYNRLRSNPRLEIAPRTFIFAGKAAPAYHFAKLVIKLVNCLATTLDSDPISQGKLNVIFLPEYCVSLAERLIAATEVSNQISTAGYEASGTSNMKFMMNGALTIGTRDGATIEMAEAAGEDNLFLFGLTAQEVADSRGWYNPYWHYEHDGETRAALDLILSNAFNPSEPGIFEPLRGALLTGGDYYMHLADVASYLEADGRMMTTYADKGDAWTRKSIINIAASGRFSSDRTISEYATGIWNVRECAIP
jgi:starch phosphorylase